MRLASLAMVLLCCPAWAAAPDYVSQIKPLLEKHCYRCHGALQQEGGLRLDTAALALTGGDSGAALVAGQPKSSPIIERITSADDSERMPQDGEPLSREEIGLLREWIEAGAAAPANERAQRTPADHWGYQPPRRVTPPALEGWGRNPIDAFVGAKHRAAGVTPLDEARPEVLLRRLHLDLTGLPPTPQQLVQFLADPSDEAYEQIVDRLLADPAYGERWGRHWMDVWRYSDWYGRRGSNEIRYAQRHIWRWRDWIIRSLNEDKGYDRMLAEMLAADELAPTDRDALAATGYLGRSWYKFDRDAWLFDTVEHAGRGLMAVTMRCARCHDHKYDPLSQREYYEFRAIFEPHGFRTEAVASRAKTEVDNGKDKVLSDGLARAFDKDLDAKTFLYQRGDPRHPDKQQPLAPSVPGQLGGSLRVAAVKLPPASYLPQLSDAGMAAVKKAGEEKIAAARKQLTDKREELADLQSRLAGLADAGPAPAKPQPFIHDDFDALDDKRWKVVSGKWSVVDGKLTQTQVTSFATLVSSGDHPRDFVAQARYRKLQPGTYRSVGFSFDYIDNGRTSQDVYTARSDKRNTGSVQAFHRKDGKQNYPREGIRDADIEVGQWIDWELTVRGDQLTIKLNGEVKLEYLLPLERTTGKFSIWVHQGSAEFERLEIVPLPESRESLAAAVAAAEHAVDVASVEEQLALARFRFESVRIDAHRAMVAKFPDKLADQFDEIAVICHSAELSVAMLKAQLKLKKAERHAALSDSDSNRAAVEQAVLAVEQVKQAGKKVDGSFTMLEPKQPTASSGRRLALARWLADPQHPRTSRVAVNHIWLRHFGEALVPSVDNFGLSGDDPSHPELLDWLALQLSDNQWRMKPTHKLIVMSSTYRLASRSPAAPDERAAKNLQADPRNRLLWRANSRRLEAEAIRDSLLAVAGKLDRQMGGPDLDESKGQSTRRRSVYYRTTPDNQMQMLTLFDQANPVECYRRRTSVIPQQALALANGPLAQDLSRQLAHQLTARAGADSADDPAFIAAAFRRVLSRDPRPTELKDCADYLQSAAKLLAGGKLQPYPASPTAPTVKPAADPRQRARENLVHVLMNHHEFVTIR